MSFVVYLVSPVPYYFLILLQTDRISTEYDTQASLLERVHTNTRALVCGARGSLHR